MRPALSDSSRLFSLSRGERYRGWFLFMSSGTCIRNSSRDNPFSIRHRHLLSPYLPRASRCLRQTSRHLAVPCLVRGAPTPRQSKTQSATPRPHSGPLGFSSGLLKAPRKQRTGWLVSVRDQAELFGSRRRRINENVTLAIWRCNCSPGLIFWKYLVVRCYVPATFSRGRWGMRVGVVLRSCGQEMDRGCPDMQPADDCFLTQPSKLPPQPSLPRDHHS